MGSSNKKVTTDTKTTSSQTTTPTVPSPFANNYFQYAGDLSGMQKYTNDPASYTVGSNANQQAAFARAQALKTDPSVKTGINSLTGLLAQPNAPGVTSQNVSTAGNNYDPALLKNINWLDYASPYTDDVVNAALADGQHQFGTALNGMNSDATSAGAFDGSRAALMKGVAAGEFGRQQALTSAQLRDQGYQRAVALAQGDVSATNQFQAQQNADNISTQQGNADRQLNADQFNANFTLQQNQFRQNVAEAAVRAGISLSAEERAQIDTIAQMGDAERAQAIAENPVLQKIAYMATTGGLLAQQNAALFTGSKTDANSTSNSTQVTSDPVGAITGLLGAAGTVMGGMGALGMKVGAKAAAGGG